MAAAIIIPKCTAPENEDTASDRNATTEVRKLMNIGTPQPRITAAARPTRAARAPATGAGGPA